MQPVYHYELDVRPRISTSFTFVYYIDFYLLNLKFHKNFGLEIKKTKAFCSAPHSGGSARVRHHFARADHGDDLIYIFGIPFDPHHKLPDGRFFSEEEKELSKRMMSGMNNILPNK